MILRNLEPPIKCNGTRAWITRIGQHTIEAEVIGSSRAGTRIVIPRIPLQSKDDESSVGRRAAVPCQFTRRQYPIRPAFAMTINKSQGQSLRYVGVDIQVRSCFSHGQFYIAVSRVTKKGNLHIIVPEDEQAVPFLGHLARVKNVQWKEVLLPENL